MGMKKVVFFVVFAVFAVSSYAQDFFDAGIKAGVNTSKISTHIENYNPQTINNYQFGAFARISLGRIYLQPEAYYNSKGGEVIDKVNLSTVNSFDLKTVDVPVLLGLKIINKDMLNLRIMTGPVFSFATDKSVEGQFTKDNLKNSVFGWQYGAGVDFLFLSFDARMESYNKNFYTGLDSKTGTFVVSLGLKLF